MCTHKSSVLRVYSAEHAGLRPMVGRRRDAVVGVRYEILRVGASVNSGLRSSPPTPMYSPSHSLFSSLTISTLGCAYLCCTLAYILLRAVMGFTLPDVRSHSCDKDALCTSLYVRVLFTPFSSHIRLFLHAPPYLQIFENDTTHGKICIKYLCTKMFERMDTKIFV